jgi:signal transduction histidine kinase
MIKKLTITGLFLIGCMITFAQTRQAINILQQRLANANNDTDRVNALADLCLLYRLGNTDTSMIYGQEAVELAQKIDYVRGQITALGYMCIVAEQQGNLPRSLELGFRAKRLAEDHSLQHLTGPATDGIGEAYIILKDYPKAIVYLRRHILISANGIDDEGMAYACFDMGVAYTGLGQLDSAIYYEERAIKVFHRIGYEEPLVYQTLGDIRIKSGKPDEALIYYKKSLEIALNKNERRASAYAFNKIAGFYKTFNQSDSAIYYAEKGLQESQMIAQKKTILEAAALLAELYESKDTKVSLRYLKIADAYKDSLFGTGNIQAVQTLVAREEERWKEIEDAKIAYQNHLRQYALIAGLAILLLIAFFLYRNNRKEKRAKRQLQDKNQIIEQTLNNLKSAQAQLIHAEKMASLGELTAGIAHEIQNPLNFVNNFSELNTELVDELKSELATGNIQLAQELADNIKDNEQKINHHGKRADSIVKGMLQHSRTSSGQKEVIDVNALVDEYVRLAYHGLKAKDTSFNATIKTDFDPAIGNMNVIPQDFGRVILNLLTNAFYAVDEKRKQQLTGYEPTVTITTKKVNGKPDSHRVEIKVADNGNGVPQKVLDKIFQPFFTTKPTGQGTGLGLSLSYDIVKAHGGAIKVETNEGEGTTFIVQVPTT